MKAAAMVKEEDSRSTKKKQEAKNTKQKLEQKSKLIWNKISCDGDSHVWGPRQKQCYPRVQNKRRMPS